MELKVFWKDVLILMRQPPDESKLHDVARLLYVVKESIIPETLEDTESKVRQCVILKEKIKLFTINKCELICKLFSLQIHILIVHFRKSMVLFSMRTWLAWFMICWMQNVSGEHTWKI